MADDYRIDIVTSARDDASPKIQALEKEIDNLKKKLGELDSTSDKTSKGVSGIFGALVDYKIFEKAATGIYTFTKQSIVAATESEELANALKNKLGKSFDDLLPKVQAATSGTISNFEIMRSASIALQKGIGQDLDQMAKLFAIAKQSGDAMGIGTTEAFDSLVQGINMGSERIFKSLGIDIPEAAKEAMKSMDDMEKKKYLTQLIIDTVKLGESTDTTADKLKRMNATMDNLKQKVGSELSPAINTLMDGLNKLNTSGEDTNDILHMIGQALDWVAKGIVSLMPLFSELGGIIADVFKAIKSAISGDWKKVWLAVVDLVQQAAVAMAGLIDIVSLGTADMQHKISPFIQKLENVKQELRNEIPAAAEESTAAVSAFGSNSTTAAQNVSTSMQTAATTSTMAFDGFTTNATTSYNTLVANVASNPIIPQVDTSAAEAKIAALQAQLSALMGVDVSSAFAAKAAEAGINMNTPGMPGTYENATRSGSASSGGGGGGGSTYTGQPNAGKTVGNTTYAPTNQSQKTAEQNAPKSSSQGSRKGGYGASGGLLPGFGGGDRVPFLLEAGEYIINKNSAQMFKPLLDAINKPQGMAMGGEYTGKIFRHSLSGHGDSSDFFKGIGSSPTAVSSALNASNVFQQGGSLSSAAMRGINPIINISVGNVNNMGDIRHLGTQISNEIKRAMASSRT